jgi:NADH:flavin oxidoreductases, Old Yellow Enzyme family
MPNMWHTVHLGSRAVGGAGLVFVEAAAVSAVGRITPACIGIWNQAQETAFRPITDFIKSQGAVPGIQLAHSGRKGSTQVPWLGRRAVDAGEGGWQPIGPSRDAFTESYLEPEPMTVADVDRVIAEFVDATHRSLRAGFEVIELHMGHGYLLHQFLSPLANKREDAFGGEFERRIAFALELTEAVRSAWPDHLPLFVRLSVTDWLQEGWDVEQSIRLAQALAKIGVDLIDCSSGSIVPESRVQQTPGYQVPLSAALRKKAGIATAAVGKITEARQAESILQAGDADLIFVARALLADPYWPLRAQQELEGRADWPVQYQRAVDPKAPT